MVLVSHLNLNKEDNKYNLTLALQDLIDKYGSEIKSEESTLTSTGEKKKTAVYEQEANREIGEQIKEMADIYFK